MLVESSHSKNIHKKNYDPGLIRDRTGDLLQAVHCTQSKNSTTDFVGVSDSLSSGRSSCLHYQACLTMNRIIKHYISHIEIPL